MKQFARLVLVTSAWTVPTFAATCVAECEVMTGYTNFSLESYVLAGTGAEVGGALRDLAAMCDAKAQERGSKLAKLITHRAFRHSHFDAKAACLGPGTN